MKEIYLVQRMERKSFRRCAHNRIKVRNLDVIGNVITMWAESKENAIEYCKRKNVEQNSQVYFVRPCEAY